MSDENRPHTPAHRAVTMPSWPLLLILVGVGSLALVLATLLGYQVGSGAEPGARAAASAPEAAQAPEAGARATQAPDEAATTAPPPPPGSDVPVPRGNASIEAPADRGMLHVPPVSVEIPAIGVTSNLVDLGLNSDNSLEVPQDYSKAGWYTPGSYPGDTNAAPALIVGHVDDSSGPAVFYELNQLEVNDKIQVTRTDGSTAVFTVYHTKQYAKTELPTDEIYADRAASELVLITCTGEFDPEAGSYLDNFVVSAVLDAEASGLAA